MELRILSGLHRGAALGLAPGSTAIGSGPACEVMLADPGVAALHARLTVDGPLLTLEAEDGPLFDARGAPLAEPLALRAGELVRLGPVWLGVFAESDAWIDAVPEPLAPTPPAAPEAGPRPAWRAQAGAVLRRVRAAAARMPLPADRRLRWALGLFAGLGLVAAGALAWSSSAMEEKAARLQARRAATAAGATAVSASAAAADAAPAVALPAAELERLFTRQLADRGLLEKLDVQLDAAAWSVQGALDDDRGRLERMVQAFERKYRPRAPIRVTLVPWSELLPFRVVQVTTGKGANVVLDSGERLFVGDASRQWRLAAVEPGKVVFDGKRRVEVAW